MIRKEKVISFGGFIPEWAKGLPKDLDFKQGYFFIKRDKVVARLEYFGDQNLYEDSRSLSCFKDILAGKQWDDPNAEKDVERYTGKWNRIKELYLPVRTIDTIIQTIKTRDSAEKKLCDLFDDLLFQKYLGGKTE